MRSRMACFLFSLVLLAGCGRAPEPAAPGPQPPAAKKIELISFENDELVRLFADTLRRHLEAQSLNEPRDYTLKIRSAQNDLTNLIQAVDAAQTDQADILITLNPQTLFTALKRAPKLNTVFGLVTSPLALGAGRSDTDHLPNLTGVYLPEHFDRIFRLLDACNLKWKAVGFLFQTGDPQSRRLLAMLEEEAGKRGMTVESVGYNTQSDVADAALALDNHRVDALFFASVPCHATVFAALGKLARDRKLPLFSTVHEPEAANFDTMVAVYVNRNHEDMARVFAEQAVKIVRGDTPAAMPFINMDDVAAPQLCVNRETAKAAGLGLPEAALRQADVVK